MLTKETILAVDRLEVRELLVPEWGGTVRVRELTGTERDAFEQACFDAKGLGGRINIRGLKAELIIRSVVDETGALLFTATDKPALLAKSARALERIYEVAQELSGLTAEAVDELLGNSESDQSGDSGSL